MCNLNILVATRKRLHSREVIEGFINATANSYASNSDAEGMYMSGTNELVKNVWKLNLIPYVSVMRRSLFLLDHTRISTSGFHEKNTQPFRVGRFIVMHNGILTFDKPTPDTTKSDTAYFCDFLMEHFRESKDMHDAIQRTLKDDVRYGSYSIAIFDTEKQILYYFKNTSTSFTIYQEEDFLFMTTSASNNVFFPYKMKKLTPEANQLYIFAMNSDGFLTVEKKKLDVLVTGYSYVGRQTSLYNDDYYKRSDYWEKDAYGGWHPKGTHDRALPPARTTTTATTVTPHTTKADKKKKKKKGKDERQYIMKWTNPDGSTDESWWNLGMWHNVHVAPSGTTSYRHGKEAEEIRASMNIAIPKVGDTDDTGDATATSSPAMNLRGYPESYDDYDYK